MSGLLPTILAALAAAGEVLNRNLILDVALLHAKLLATNNLK